MPDKKAILARLHQKAAAGVPIIGTGAGTGLTAKAEAEGDADLIIACYDGKSGGTLNTLRYAIERDIQIVHLPLENV